MFYTNLEDTDRTLTIDLTSRQVTRPWLPGCDADGPKGLAVDHGFDFLVVACRAGAALLDVCPDRFDGLRSSTTTGITRLVRDWYSAYCP